VEDHHARYLGGLQAEHYIEQLMVRCLPAGAVMVRDFVYTASQPPQPRCYRWRYQGGRPNGTKDRQRLRVRLLHVELVFARILKAVHDPVVVLEFAVQNLTTFGHLGWSSHS